ncbi:TPA: hypothetical protein QDA86_004991 [Burkholderia vietnamiensis]|nr:hypothetical protein [Burkholderia vietnamiensis]
MKQRHRASQPKKQKRLAGKPKKQDPHANRLEEITKTQSPSIDIPVEKFGPAGIKGEIHVVPQFASDGRSDMARLQDDAEREFAVSARLSKTPPSTEQIMGNFDENDGDSYLTAPHDAVMLRAETSEGTFEAKKNRLGELSLVEFTCRATSVSDARSKFQLAVLPFLDKLAYEANCPIFVATTRIEDRQNQCTTVDCTWPYRKAIVNPHEAAIYPEMKPVYAMYREAQNSHSDFYKFLCYYKILEGIFRHIRINTFRTARENGVVLQRIRDMVPQSAEIPEEFRQYSGTPLQSFFDSVMTPEFRNALAHFAEDDGAVLDMSSPDHIKRYSGILFIAELCAREAIKNQEHLSRDLRANNRA